MSLIQIGPGQYKITAPGDYAVELGSPNPSLTVPAVEIIGVPFVTVRLSRRFEGEGGPSTNAVGVKAIDCPCLKIIGDGAIIRGFLRAVDLVDCYLAQVTGLFVQDGWLEGIRHTGPWPTITNNKIFEIGGYAGDTADVPATSLAFGINTAGSVPTIKDNVIRNVRSSRNEAVGIAVRFDGAAGIVEGNIVRCDATAPILGNDLPGSWGVWIGGGDMPAVQSNVEVVHNHIVGWGVGIGMSSPTAGLIDENSFRNCIEVMRISSGEVLIGENG